MRDSLLFHPLSNVFLCRELSSLVVNCNRPLSGNIGILVTVPVMSPFVGCYGEITDAWHY